MFDIGGVFTYPNYTAVNERLVELGLPQPEDSVTYRRAHHGAVRALLDHTNAGAATDEASADYWNVYDRAYALEVGVPASAADDVGIAIRTAWDWVHEANVASFHRLAAGTPVAIVSNNDGTAPEQMRDYGVCQVGQGPLPSVAAIVDSTLVGVAKPDPAIFEPALGALGVPAERVLYVGDTVQADVRGALAAGMQVVQLDPFDHHDDYEHARAVDVSSVMQMLEAG